MASGDGTEETIGGDDRGGGPTAEPADGSPRGPQRDPAVDIGWLERGSRRHTGHLPRLSTVLLIGAFVAVLVLYLMLQPG